MKCLVVVDMQNDFITGPLGTSEAQIILPKVINKVKSFNGIVFATADTHDSLYPITQEGKNLPIKHCVEGSNGWMMPKELIEILPKSAKPPIRKNTFGSRILGFNIFHLYEEFLFENGEPIDEVILVGLCTDICIISNALLLKAYVPDIKITVDASCCAGTSPEAHEIALKAMQQCQINIENWEGDLHNS